MHQAKNFSDYVIGLHDIIDDYGMIFEIWMENFNAIGLWFWTNNKSEKIYTKMNRKKEEKWNMNQIENVVEVGRINEREMNGLNIIHRLLYGVWTMVLNCIQCCVQS